MTKDEYGPTHVKAQPGDRLSLCGLKDPLPSVLARFVSAHKQGHGMKVCPLCAERMLAAEAEDALTCESCGQDADVVLNDGSTWCINCDMTARELGYDNRPGVLLGSN